MTFKQKNHWLRLAAAGLVALSLAACSGGSGSGSEGNSQANRAPIAASDTVQANGGSLAISVLGNDVDPDGDSLHVVFVGTPAHGTATLDDAGTPGSSSDDFILYTPAAAYTGADRFSYTVGDDSDGRASGEVNILAMPSTSAQDKLVATPMGTPVSISVLDSPVAGILSMTAPAFGSVTINQAGTPADPSDDFLVYTPVAGYSGLDTFYYTLSGLAGIGTAAVVIEVTATPTLPATPNVRGQVMKGPVREARVEVFEMGPDGIRFGLPIAATITDAQGRWALSLPTLRPNLLVKASGGEFDDETRSSPGRTLALDAAPGIFAVLPGNENFLVSSIYTNAMYLRALHAAGSSNFAAEYSQIRADSFSAWSFDLSVNESADPAAPNPAQTLVSHQHAMALGGAANALDRIVTALGMNRPNGDAIFALSRDLSDCRLDGNDFAGAITVFAQGLDRSIENNLDLNLEILRFRNNNFNSYAGTPLAVWNDAICAPPTAPVDNLAPTVTVDLQRLSSGSPALRGAIDDPAAVVRVTVNGATYSAVNRGNYWQLDAGIIAPALGDGTYDVVVEATDMNGNAGTDLGSVDLIIDALAPVISIDSLQSNDGSPALSGTIDDPTATVTVQIAGTDYPAVVAGTNWSLAAGVISPTLTEGVYAAVVTAVDSFSNSGMISATAAVTVSVNAAPTFSISGDIVVDEDFVGARLVTVTPAPVPADELSQQVVYRLTPAVGDYADVSINPSNGTVYVSAIEFLNGSQTFSIIADDGQSVGNLASQTFTLTVNPVNSPPAFVMSGDIAETTGFAGVRSVTAVPSPVPDDESLQIVTYSLSPPSVAFADITFDSSTGTVSVSAVPGQNGNQIFNVSADDGQADNNLSTASFLLTVSELDAENVVPVIDGQQPLSTPEEVALLLSPTDLLVTDPDNIFPDDFSLSVQSGANYSVLGNTITPATNFVGNLTVPVVISDGAASSNLFNLDIVVSPINDAPAFSLSGNISESEDFIGTRLVTVSADPVPADESAQNVVYSLSPASVAFANVSIDPMNGTVTVSAIAEQSGSQIFTVTADDGQAVNNSVSQNFSLSVAGNTDPTSSGIADVNVLEDATDTVIDLFAAFDDVEDADAALSYGVVGNTNPGLFDSIVIDPIAGTLTLAFTADVSGSGVMTLRATDSGSDYVETSFNVTVNKEADLSISALTVSDPAPGIGRNVDFSVTVTNTGPSTATGVVVNISLPAGYEFVDADDLANYSTVTGNWTLSTLTGSASLLLTTSVNAAGPYNLTAELIAANESDPDSTPANDILAEDDQRSVSTSPRPVTNLGLGIIVDDPIPAPGATVEFIVTVEALGPFDATGISVSLPPLPGQLTYESAVPSAGAFNRTTGLWSGFDVNWSGDPMLPFSATVEVIARVDLSVPITTVLLTTASLAGLDQVNSDGPESDTSSILVLGDGIDHQWEGGAGPDPTDWHNENNWSSGLVPTLGDNVVIPPTAFDPVLNANALSLATLDIEAGAQLFLNGNILSTVGDLDARDGPIVGPGLVQLEFGQLRGTVPDLEILTADPAIEVEFDGDVTVNGDLTISQGRIDTSVQTVVINGDLLSTGTGLLLQKSDSEIFVNGDALFDGGDYTQLVNGKAPLRNGELYVTGDFTQTGHPHSFAAEDDHLVILNGAADQTIFFQNPDSSNPEPDATAAVGSRFANLRIDKDADTDGLVTVLSDVVVLRQLQQSEFPVLSVITAMPASGFVLMIGGADLDEPLLPAAKNIVFDNLPVQVFQGDSRSQLESMVFRNMDPSVVQLSIARRDFVGPKELVDTVFETLPDFAAGGRYLTVDNLHPDPNRNLTFEVLESKPLYGTPMTEVFGNTNVIWGTGTEDTDRDGILDADEYILGINPMFADSDHDGLSDPDEIAAGADPFVADTDGDGISDGAEVAAGGDPTVATAPGTILYVRQAPLGNDANTGFGGWGDALATNVAVAAALIDGAGPGVPFYVLYDAGVYAPLEIDNFSDLSLVGSLGPGITVPSEPPTTLFDASSIPDTAVIRIIDSTSITVQSMHLSGASNFAGGGDGSVGGGVYVENSSASLSQLTVEDNVAADAGGGVYIDLDSTVTVENSSIRRNSVPAGGIAGGGIAVYGGLQLSNSVIAGNRYEGNTSGGGGIYAEPAGPITIRDNKILSNYSAESGGGMMLFNVNAPLDLFNNLIAGNANDAGQGGALFGDKMDRGQITRIESNTIAFNRSLADSDSAGGIHFDRADDVQMRDNVLRFNVDGDAIDELQDQYMDDSAAAFFEYNSFEDFGAGDLNNNDGDNPRFELGFYLRPDSSVDDTGSQTATAAGLDLPYTTSADGAADTGILDRGFHYQHLADGEADGVVLTGQVAECATNTLTLHFAISGFGGDLGAGHLVGAQQDGSDTAGGTLTTLTGIRPFGGPGTQLAMDGGDGLYHVSIVGVSHSGGEIAALDIEIDDDNSFLLNSTDLGLLFAAEGC